MAFAALRSRTATPLSCSRSPDSRSPAISPKSSPPSRRGSGGTLDGVVAKRLDMAYCSGDRTGMQKIKRMRTADCIVGGFRYGTGSKTVGSLLLGLYDEEGLLNHVGFCSGLSAAEKK